MTHLDLFYCGFFTQWKFRSFYQYKSEDDKGVRYHLNLYFWGDKIRGKMILKRGLKRFPLYLETIPVEIHFGYGLEQWEPAEAIIMADSIFDSLDPHHNSLKG